MIEGSFSYFDIAVLSVMGLSCLFAFFRGFVKEILSLGAWIGAGLITVYWFPSAAEALKPHFKSPVVATGFATLGIYIGALLCFSIVNAVILRFLKEGSDVGILDNSLGLAFGAFRGAFVVSLAYLMMTMVMNEESYPAWLAHAKTRPLVEEGAVLLARAAPEYLREQSSLHSRIQGGAAETQKAHMKDSLNDLLHREASPAR